MIEKTTVNWLIEQLDAIDKMEDLSNYIDKKKKIIEDAKKLEKERVLGAYLHGCDVGYYNKKKNKKNKDHEIF
jgi:hypothetical protein